MTNIRTNDMFPIILPEIHRTHPYPSRTSLMDLFGRRDITYSGFAKIEKEKGLLAQRMSLSTSEGQEAVRILTQRGLEEMAEAYDSSDRDHYLEELIDAVNYFWVLAIIDPVSPTIEIIDIMVNHLMDHVHEHVPSKGILFNEIGRTVVSLNPIFEKLRHRAWMHNPQHQYFDGWLEIANFLGENLCLVWDEFESWQEFCQFFIAKDNVLQFRINSKY